MKQKTVGREKDGTEHRIVLVFFIVEMREERKKERKKKISKNHMQEITFSLKRTEIAVE